MICPHCKKEIIYQNTTKDYSKMISILEKNDGKILTTTQIKNLLSDFYSFKTNIHETALVRGGILENRGYGIYLVKIPSKDNFNKIKKTKFRWW